MRVSPIKFATLCCLLLSASAWGRPPYAVVGYCYTTTKASTTSLNGSGGAINWTTDIPWNDLTVIADAFMVPNTNDTFSNGGAKNAALVGAAHAQGVRCIVSIGGAGQDGSFSTLCLPANRAAFATAIANLVTQYNYDGVDIDWETPTNQQADATAMMVDIYNDLKALPSSSVDNKSRTLSFTTVDYIDQIYNMTTLANYTDWCFFMGYDWYACPSLANGPLNSEQSEIASLTNGSLWSYPISKMVLGCPLYTNDYNPSACTANEYPTLSILHLGTPGAYDSAWAEQAYTAPNGDTVYVDTAQSYCDKTNWALGAGLMGIGMWDIGLALPYTDSAVSGLWSTIGGTASCLGLGPTSTPTVTPTPVVSSTWRVNAGGPSYTDSQGKLWAADENYSGGTAAAASTNPVSGALPGAADQALYQTQRYGTSFSYTFNVPAGSYQVTLKFAETYFTAAGSRVFNVAVNGATVLTNFDVFAAAGGENIAIDK
ncbi:MAG TPA: glycosyl hydrolase family 18 protein, partial [bacterium]|nr:glycosyl hydrolase family 18 protein [bacterium]